MPTILPKPTGSIFIWKKILFNAASESGWQLTDISHIIKGSIKKCVWGTVDDMKPCIVANCISNVYILKEQPLLSCHRSDIWAVQRATNQIFVETGTQQTTIVTCDISVTQFSLTDLHLAVTNGKVVTLYKIQKTSQDSIDDVEARITLHDNLAVRFSSSFHCDNGGVFVYEQHVICIDQKDIKVLSENGVKLQSLSLTEHEGKIIGSDLTGRHLTVFTFDGFVKIYDAHRHELKLVVPAKNAYDLFENFGEVMMAKVNRSGTLCAMMIANDKLVPDGRVYFWNLETDLVTFYEDGEFSGSVRV
jgi:intraflagellar transport protein 140